MFQCVKSCKNKRFFNPPVKNKSSYLKSSLSGAILQLSEEKNKSEENV